ncbi:MAG: alpha-galactosidase [Acidobacteriia bacterium]|nr:alpha-galactosidase [Terriglobia bacterium]
MSHGLLASRSALPRKVLAGVVLTVGIFVPAWAGAAGAASPAPVRYLPHLKVWILDTERTSYVLGLNERNELQSLYWGEKLASERDLFAAHSRPGIASFDSSETVTNNEYPGWGGRYYNEPALKVTLADGVRDLVLKYVSQEIRGDTLVIRLKDIQYDLFVNLTYTVFPREDIIRKQAEIQNHTSQALNVESAQSGVWYMPVGEGYRLTYLTGRWAGETQLTREPINPGKVVLESRRGNTSHQLNPWFAIDVGGAADEEHGRVWFGALGWSGNWKLVVEDTPAAHQVRVTGGYNDFDFSWPLKPGENLSTPPYYGGFSSQGFGEASRLLHRFERDEVLPDRAHPHVRPVLYNSWEATEFDVNEPSQKSLAEKAAKLGVELFVMDDGWFGQRNNDRAGLGDWTVNRQKFPNGLGPLISYVNGLGMDFGLWFEPEMVNPDSDLYRQHPDWAMNFPGRPRSEARNQLVLNMARDDVKEYVFHALDQVLSENNIEYIKWDMNRHFSEPGWPEVPVPEQKGIWVKYVRNVYEIIDRLRAKHPNLEIESCSGGGGRVDLGILERVNEVWTSDNTEAFDRLRIQEGFSFAYAPKIMSAWVTDVPNMNGRSTPLKFRFLVAMQGALGIGANLNKWSPEDFALATQMVSTYKSIRETVQQGDLYRLFSPREGNLTANEYVSADGKQAVLFGFLHSQQFLWPAPMIYLRGLEENALYRIKTIDNKLIVAPGIYAAEGVSGAYLMHHGLRLDLRGDYDSSLVILERTK